MENTNLNEETYINQVGIDEVPSIPLDDVNVTQLYPESSASSFSVGKTFLIMGGISLVGAATVGAYMWWKKRKTKKFSEKEEIKVEDTPVDEDDLETTEM